EEIAILLELKGETSFRVLAYRNGARAVEQLEEDIGELVRSGRIGAVRGIGETLRDKITTLVKTGSLPYYEDLKAKTPPGLLRMLRIDGLGPKRVKVLYEQLGVDDLDKLRAACQAGQVAELKGFGLKSQQKILEGIDFLDEVGGRVRIDQALPLGERIVAELRKVPGVVRIELAGSLRRRRETVKDVDIVASSDDPQPLMEHFVHLPGVRKIIGHGDTKSSIAIGDGSVTLHVDLRVARDSQYPNALQHFSGSKEHNVALRTRAQARGWKINEYELLGPDGPVPVKTETDIYKALGYHFIPPEMRENTGEVEAAAAG